MTSYVIIENDLGKFKLPKDYLPTYLGGKMDGVHGDVGYLSEGRVLSRYVIDAASAFITPDSIVVDVGAHMGTMSMAFSEILKLKGSKTGQVISIEAALENFPCVEYNVRNNGQKGVKNYVYNLVCTSSPIGTVNFPKHDISTGLLTGQYSLDNHANQSREYNQVKSTSLDSLLARKRKKISLIKVDCEGHDPDVLLGSIETIKKHKPAIIFEWNRQYDNFEKHVEQANKGKHFLAQIPKGYKFVDIHRGNDWLLFWDK